MAQIWGEISAFVAQFSNAINTLGRLCDQLLAVEVLSAFGGSCALPAAGMGKEVVAEGAGLGNCVDPAARHVQAHGAVALLELGPLRSIEIKCVDAPSVADGA